MDLRLCTVEYSSSHIDTEATLVDVNFSQECRSQMISFLIQISSCIVMPFLLKRVFCLGYFCKRKSPKKKFNFILVSLIFDKLSTFTFLTNYPLSLFQVTVCQPVHSPPEYGQYDGENACLWWKWKCHNINIDEVNDSECLSLKQYLKLLHSVTLCHVVSALLTLKFAPH